MKNNIVIAVALVLSILTSLVSIDTYALPGGASWNKGYFNGLTIGSGTGVDKVLTSCGGSAPFDSSMTNKTTFINRVVSYYTGGCSTGRNDTGARFIMLTILNRPASASRSSGNDLITDWTNYVNGSGVGIVWMTGLTFNYNSGCYSNSGCDNGGEDEYFKNANRFGDSLVFYDTSNGSIIYALKYDCGNPVGYDNIPNIPVNWSISVSSSANKTSAQPGDVITWTHRVTNNGPGTTSSNVAYHYQNRQDLGNGIGANNILSSGAASGASASFTSTYTVSSNDAGKTLCRSTSASPKSNSDSGWIESTAACVSVPYDWSISTTSSADRTTAKPGDTITWTHTVKNDGPTETDENVTYHYQNRQDLGSGTGTNNTLSSGTASGTIKTFTSTYLVTQSDVGKNNLCRATSASPKKEDDSGWVESSQACVSVPYKYTLAPLVTLNPSGVVEAGAIINITPSVSNSGPTNSRNTNWELTQILVDPDKDIPPGASGGASPKDPCGTYFKVPGIINSCSTKAKGVAVFNENDTTSYVSGDQFQSSTYTTADLPAGSKVCYSLAVKHYSEDSSIDQWMYSNPVCVIVVKKPKTQIWGGDLWSGNSIDTGTSVKDVSGIHTFGSWVEYGVFAKNSISGTASGSAFAGTSGLTGNNPICNYSTLMFTSAGSSACSASTTKGSYNNTHILPDIAASFPGGNNVSGTVSPDSLIPSSGTFVGNASGNLTVSASTLAPGKTVILKALNNTITISGNQTYNPNNNGSKYTSGGQLPQLIIIADKIIINGGVTNVDAWLVANGTNGILETCDTSSSTYALSGNNRLTVDRCNQQLTVNGPVIAKQLWLRRTAGSGTGTSSNDPAEIFNLRADAYLWALSRATKGDRIQTVLMTGLPPRF